MNNTVLRVQCQECGGVSQVSAQAVGPRGILHCPRCFVLTSRWHSLQVVRVTEANGQSPISVRC